MTTNLKLFNELQEGALFTIGDSRRVLKKLTDSTACEPGNWYGGPFQNVDPGVLVFPLDSVEIIASGYEWTCPHCETFHHEIEVTTFVHCDECRRTFEVGDYHHALA